MLGALLGAHAAALALVVVHTGHAVHNVDGIKLTGALAHAAGNAGGGAQLVCHSTLILIGAHDHGLAGAACVDHNNVLGADVGAGTTAGALVLVHLCHTVYDVDSADESNGYGIVEPLLVQIPYSVEGTGEGNHLVWEVSAEPKASERPPKPEKPSGHKKHPSSDHPDNVPASSPEADTTTGINGPRTGDNSPLAGYAIMIVSASLLIIWLAGRMKKLRE